MKRFEFRYSLLLRMKKQELQLVEQRMAQLNHHRTQLRNRLADTDEKIQDLSATLALKFEDDTNIDCESLLGKGHVLSREIEELRRCLTEADQAHASLQQAFKQLKTRVDSLESLRERRSQAHQLQQERHQLSEIDDMVMRDWSRGLLSGKEQASDG